MKRQLGCAMQSARQKKMLEQLIHNRDSWLNGKGPESEIVFSSRIRLARNIAGIPFPSRAAAAFKQKVLQTVSNTYPGVDELKSCTFINMEQLSSLERQLLLERHLVSREHTIPDKSKGLIVSGNEEISLMINEEDHLRIQVIAAGLDLKRCWKVLDGVDNGLSRKIDFSFRPDWGYLTACPTNVGTALRASCMLHLPALIFTKRINKILELLSRIAFTIRGLFGEGTQALGNFFQISNQVSLGLSEEELMSNLTGVVNQIKVQELDARSVLLRKYRPKLEDSVWRALGILRNARLINSKEALGHLSVLSLGLDLGIIKDTDFAGRNFNREAINALLVMIQPAHLQKIEGKSLSEKERDHTRAEILRKKLCS